MRAKYARKSESSETVKNTAVSSAQQSPHVNAFLLTANEKRDNMAQRIKEEQMRVRINLNEHHHTGRDHSQEANDIHDTDSVEDDVAWSGQRLGRQSHLVRLFRGLLLAALQFGGDGFEALALERELDESARIEGQPLVSWKPERGDILVGGIESHEHVLLAIVVLVEGSGTNQCLRCPAVVVL